MVVLRSLAVTAALAWAFLGVGLWISAAARTPERATILALVAWLGASALDDFALVGALLRFKLAPEIVFALAALNPAESTRIAILSGVDPDLSVLGPMAFCGERNGASRGRISWASGQFHDKEWAMKTLFSMGIVAAVTLVGLAACSKSSAPESTTTTASSAPAATGGGKIDVAQAKEMFNSRCATCHGTDGTGSGPAAAALNPKPRNYHDKEWQKKVTDDDLRKTITLGGAAVGKSPIMPASPDLDSKPEVVDGLIQIIREFGK